MIAFLRGTVAASSAYTLLLEAGGIGYELYMSSKALASMPAVGEECLVYVHMHIKDDKITLFGFKDMQEKSVFLSLTGVSGIGPKLAVAALSTYTASELAAYVSQGDVAAISRVPGIGKKTASRVVLELKGALVQEDESSLAQDAQCSALADARAALLSMGFTQEEAAASLKGLDAGGMDAAHIIKAALRQAGGR